MTGARRGKSVPPVARAKRLQAPHARVDFKQPKHQVLSAQILSIKMARVVACALLQLHVRTTGWKLRTAKVAIGMSYLPRFAAR